MYHFLCLGYSRGIRLERKPQVLDARKHKVLFCEIYFVIYLIIISLKIDNSIYLNSKDLNIMDLI